MRTHAGCRFSFAASASLALLLLAQAPAVSAQSDPTPRPNGVVVHDAKSVPANGGVLVLVPTRGHPGPETKAAPATIDVQRAGVSVAGTLTEIGWVEDITALSLSTDVIVGAGLVWTADEPLEPDARYDVKVEVLAADPFEASFLAAKSWSPERPLLSFAAELGSVDTGQREEHCCSPFLDGSGHGGCFVKRYAEVPALAPTLDADDAAEHLQQFVYLFRAFDPDTDATLWASGYRTYESIGFQVPFLSSQDEYCVEMEAKHIVSGELFSWSHCVSADELPDGVLDPTEDIAAALQLEHCSVPEYGDVLQWCEINRDACLGSEDPACAVYDSLCGGTLLEALDVLMAMDDVREGRAHEPDAGAHAGHEQGQSDAGADMHAPSQRGGGCRIALGHADGHDAAALSALALLWVVLQRRSRVRRRHA